MLKNIKSGYILKIVFDNVENIKQLKIIKYSKKLSKKLNITLDTFEKTYNNKKKKEILIRQENLRNNIVMTPEEKIKIILEDMSILGNILIKEIIEDKNINPKKFISIEETTKKDDNNLCLGVLAKYLENKGIITVIDDEDNEDDVNISFLIIEFLFSGLFNINKYILSFDFGIKRNNELLKNINEQNIFNNKIKNILSVKYNIPEKEILITSPIPKKTSGYHTQVIFISEINQNIDIFPLTFQSIKNSKKYNEFTYLKNVMKSLILDGCKLNTKILDPRGNTDFSYIVNRRGPLLYETPLGWMGYGIKVLDKYDDGCNDWLRLEGRWGEWIVAFKNLENKNYCSNRTIILEENEKKVEINNQYFKIGFMIRVNPDKIKCSTKNNDYWTFNPVSDEIRPYRILIKKI